jgi:hypothetical protein
MTNMAMRENWFPMKIHTGEGYIAPVVNLRDADKKEN